MIVVCHVSCPRYHLRWHLLDLSWDVFDLSSTTISGSVHVDKLWSYSYCNNTFCLLCRESLWFHHQWLPGAVLDGKNISAVFLVALHRCVRPRVLLSPMKSKWVSNTDDWCQENRLPGWSSPAKWARRPGERTIYTHPQLSNKEKVDPGALRATW